MTNQLVSETSLLPDLDEYAGIAIKDIAIAVTYWPDGSEEQARAIAAIQSRAPGIGHNRPPLSEALDEELAPRRARVQELVKLADSAVIIDADSSRKVADLLKMIRDEEEDLDAARKKRSKPYRDAQKVINDAYGRIALPLVLARSGESGKAGLVGAITAYDNRMRAALEAEKKRALEEQQRREREAAEAQRKAEEAAAAGKNSVQAELFAIKAKDEAARAAARAEAIRPTPIRSHLGTVSRRREIKFEMTDPLKFADWALEQAAYRNHLLEALRTVANTVMRSAGVAGVDKGLDIPGLKAWVEQGSATVRR